MTHHDIVGIRLVPLGASSYGKSSLLPAIKSRQAAKQNNSAVSGLVEMKGEKKSSML
jgi:hypothetical protein